MAARRCRIKAVTNIPQRRRAELDISSSVNEDDCTENKISSPTEEESVVCAADCILKEQILSIIESPVVAKDDSDATTNETNVNLSEHAELPPPSPVKLTPNRNRVWAVPHINATQKYATSASESDVEEPRKRVRTESVSSSVAGTESALLNYETTPPKDFSAALEQKLRRSENTRKLAEARREFLFKFGNKTPQRNQLTMMDLIFYNPTTNPMSESNTANESNLKVSEIFNLRKNKPADNPARVGGGTSDEDDDRLADDESAVVGGGAGAEDDTDDDMIAPQIKINQYGEIVVDEQSLVIENKEVKKQQKLLQKSKVIDADSYMDKFGNVLKGGFNSNRNNRRSKVWSKYDTLKFYRVLNTVGTDFALMAEVFPRRNRRDLKLKFKREERINRALIDRAIMEPSRFDFNQIKKLAEVEELEHEFMEKAKTSRLAQLRQPIDVQPTTISNPVKQSPRKPRQRNLSIMSFLDDEEPVEQTDGRIVRPCSGKAATETENNEKINEPGNSGQNQHRFYCKDAECSDASIGMSDEENMERRKDLEAQQRLASSLTTKPTRSGRLPKLISKYAYNVDETSRGRRRVSCKKSVSLEQNIKTKTQSSDDDSSNIVSTAKPLRRQIDKLESCEKLEDDVGLMCEEEDPLLILNGARLMPNGEIERSKSGARKNRRKVRKYTRKKPTVNRKGDLSFKLIEKEEDATDINSSSCMRERHIINYDRIEIDEDESTDLSDEDNMKRKILEEEQQLVHTLAARPTRSGRLPKIISKFADCSVPTLLRRRRVARLPSVPVKSESESEPETHFDECNSTTPADDKCLASGQQTTTERQPLILARDKTSETGPVSVTSPDLLKPGALLIHNDAHIVSQDGTDTTVVKVFMITDATGRSNIVIGDETVKQQLINSGQLKGHNIFTLSMTKAKAPSSTSLLPSLISETNNGSGPNVSAGSTVPSKSTDEKKSDF